MNTEFQKMQAEHSALILFCAIVAAIIGMLFAVISHYPAPAMILASIAAGAAAGVIITSRRENRFLAARIQESPDARLYQINEME